MYSDYSECKDITDRNMDFIFTAKPASHKWMFSNIDKATVNTLETKEWTGRNHLVYHYSWCNGLEIRAELPTMSVNYFAIEIWNKEKDKVTYTNSWITSLDVDKDNVQTLVKCARARWKIENEHNNVLKNRGYNLEHNFGHGNNYACEVYCLLDLLAFQMHGLMIFLDVAYKKAHSSTRRIDEFHFSLRYIFSRLLFIDWDAFMAFIARDT